MRRLEVLLNKQAKRLKVSHHTFGSALKALRIAAAPGTYFSYKRGAADLGTETSWADFIPKAEGFQPFGPSDLPGIDEVVAACQALYQTRLAEQADRMERKPFFANILEPDDLQAHPEIMDFVLSDAVVRSVTGYLGTVPRLMGVGLYISPPNESLKSSQLFHFDGDDFRQVKCFINLVDVDEDNGPFTFYDANASALVEQQLGRPWGAYRYDDGDIASVCRDHEKHVLMGAPGHGAFVDTARCVHFGSRARRSSRVVLMFHYVTVPDLKIRKGAREFEGGPIFDFAQGRFEDDRLRTMILAGRAK
ncbi:MAG: hypothetical protein HOK30_02805 [Rhodospirillaceae bacterium]|jgi:hypothetical protein|nr:hypothetical protein [Rhodospirillaceae bacterium]MBT5193096.1 hypothetical protein [Rhodospirillaceae bacterium]MBT5898744.1 hypothetical protein [Rhodospirillaceae bacterium]MBT6426568.1 hypothetical protein [Rhodospirillaceae bacterium]MBT7756107.1 hypothetical protein [Rhodospirillaceae bacterium]